MRYPVLLPSTNTTSCLGRLSTTTNRRPDIALAFFHSARDASPGAGSRIRAKGVLLAQTRYSPVFPLSLLSVLFFCERRLSRDPQCLCGFRGRGRQLPVDQLGTVSLVARTSLIGNSWTGFLQAAIRYGSTLGMSWHVQTSAKSLAARTPAVEEFTNAPIHS